MPISLLSSHRSCAVLSERSSLLVVMFAGLMMSSQCATTQASTPEPNGESETRTLSVRLFDLLGEMPRLIEVDGCRLRFVDVSPDRLRTDATPWLLVHGIGGSMGDFGPFLLGAAARWRVLTLDLPGFGGSSNTRGDYRIVSYVRVLKAFLNALEVKRVHLVCHSLGGQICVGFALEQARRVETLTLIDAAGMYDRGEYLRQVASAHARLNVGSLEAQQQAFLELLTAGRQQLVRRIVGDDPFLFAALDSYKNNYRHRVVDLDVPLLVIWGVDDPVFPVENAFFLKENVADAELRLIEGAGHSPHVDHADLILNWIERSHRRQRARAHRQQGWKP